MLGEPLCKARLRPDISMWVAVFTLLCLWTSSGSWTRLPIAKQNVAYNKSLYRYHFCLINYTVWKHRPLKTGGLINKLYFNKFISFKSHDCYVIEIGLGRLDHCELPQTEIVRHYDGCWLTIWLKFVFTYFLSSQ